MNPSELINERDTLRCQLHDAREQLARDSATITRVTAEREDWKIRAEEMDGYKADCMALRARVAELEALLSSEKSTRNAIIAKGQAVEQRNAELVAALRDLRVAYEQNASQCVQLNRELKIDTVEWLNGTAIQRDRAEKAEARVAELVAALRETLDDPNSTISGALYYRMEQVLARAESATPDHIRDAAQMVSPAKHPDTEIVDWLDSAECYRWMISWGGEHEEELHKMRPWKIRDAVRYCIAARNQEATRHE